MPHAVSVKVCVFADSAEVLVLEVTQAQPIPFAAVDCERIEKHLRRGLVLKIRGHLGIIFCVWGLCE